jgi:ATP-dependent DNA helicase PIF1
MQFSREQQIAFDKYIQGKNIFITGPGGTGKSALIRYIQKDACRKGFDIQVCALTGCAAVLLECKAKTVHSWAGIGLANVSIENIVTRVIRNRNAKANWKSIDILIIDEVSMMSQKLFEALDTVGKAVRKNRKPFGGIQLIFSGDFYQLPPVGNKDEPETSSFCFQSPQWNQTFSLDDHVSLVKIFRQNDDIYQRILNQIREGRLRRSSVDTLIHHVGREFPEDADIRPTKLFPTRNKVEYINTSEMSKLNSPEIEYKIKYHADLEMSEKDRLIRLQYTREQIQTELQYLQSNLPVDEVIKLKVGAQVMCVVNIQLSNGDILCNGSQGIIVSTQEQGLPVVKYRNGYVMTMSYHIWSSELIPGIGVSQIPLIPAWALTIHKSQGATLDIAEIDVGSGIFECGQTYVALSRVKSLEGLYLTSFDAKKVRINRKVQEFYQVLEEFESKRKSNEENEARAVEKMPEAIATVIEVPMVEAIVVTNFDRFANELDEEDYK